MHILLTGGSGVLGHRMLNELLTSGHKVRVTSRPNKVSLLRSLNPGFSSDVFDISIIEDLVTADYTEALKGIDAVIHLASPVSNGGATPQELYEVAVTGTQRVLTAAGECKTVKRFVMAGSVGGFFKLDYSNVTADVVFDENTFRELEDIDPTKYNRHETYLACKTITDKLVWKAADRYPDIDFTVIYPPCVYGAFLDGYPTPPDVPSLNANQFIYQLLTPNAVFPPFPVIAQVHTKDVTRAHILALTAPPLSSGRRKRLILTSGEMPWIEAVEYLKAQRPDLAWRVVNITEEAKASLPRFLFKLDTKLTEEVLGLNSDNMINWREALLEVADWVLEWEKKSGLKVGGSIRDPDV